MTDKTTFYALQINLIKERWTKKDIKVLKEKEKTLIGDKKSCEFEKKIVNTALTCFGNTSVKVKPIYKEIKKGNYLSFLNNLKIENHFESILCAYLISAIKDFATFKSELLRFLATIDNWASCDSISFLGKDKEKLLDFSDFLLIIKGVFYKRVGIRIYFELIKDKNYLPLCFKMLDSLRLESEYYVNMCAAWLLCECFIKHREQTLLYFKSPKTNDFIINKAISKCRDSFRVSDMDKEMLNQFKK